MSLLELLIYMSVLLILTIAIVASTMSLSTVFARNKSARVLTDAAAIVAERLTRDIRDADSVNLLLSTLNATSSVLVLENGATTTTYSIVGGNIVIDVEGVALGALTPDEVLVNKFSAVRYAGTDSEAVRVTMSLSVVGRYASTTEIFYSAGVLRGSYEE